MPCCTVSAKLTDSHRPPGRLTRVGERGMPAYRRIADEILSMIASGKLGQQFTVPEAAQLARVKYSAARRAAEHLAREGAIESYQGSGYRALVTPSEAAASRADNRPFRVQVSELRHQVADLREAQEHLREAQERIEASVEDLYDQSGYTDGTSEHTEQQQTSRAR